MNRASSPLKRHILVRLLIVAGVLSALLLAAFLSAYRNQLLDERSRASLGFNLLLQATLENAMLKRDVPGLAEIVRRLGTQPGIRGVMILNPAGTVRFSSAIERLGQHLPALIPGPDAAPSARFVAAEDGADVLRSINPVRNKAPCAPCHGLAQAHPVNGILVVDYDASEIRAQAWQSALAFAAAGIAVLTLIMVMLWRSLNHRVLKPVAVLGRASAALERGELEERVHLPGNDEFTALGERFNRMAERIGKQIERLRAHEAYLQEILDGLPDGVRVIRARDMTVVLANRAYCRQLDGTADDVIGKPCYRCGHNRDTPCPPTLMVCPLHELHEIGAAIKTTHHCQRLGGSRFPAEIHAMLIELDNGNGRERYLIESVRDLGQTLRISHEQRLSELGLLAAGIAHEIHNPLGSMRLGVQGLTREVRAGHIEPDHICAYMDMIDREIDNCIAVTRRLLLLARPPAGSLQLVVLNEALADTMSLLAYDAQTHEIRQRLELPEQPLRVLAEESEIRMILLNLIQNAHHAMPEGGTLTARLSIDDGMAVIEIADTGVGMTSEQVARIFDPFYSRRADGVAGTGIGLTLVKNFIERMGGDITVDSAPGQGTTFRIRLALADSPSGNSS